MNRPQSVVESANLGGAVGMRDFQHAGTRDVIVVSEPFLSPYWKENNFFCLETGIDI